MFHRSLALAAAAAATAVAATTLGPATLAAQAVQYEVSVPSPGARLLVVKADFAAAGKDTLFVSLPAWSPGSYEIQNVARYVRRFSATRRGGAELAWDRLDKDTWRIPTAGADHIAVELELIADTIDLALPRITADGGWFLGTNAFLFEEGQLSRPAEVRFTLPEGWRVTTALRSTGEGRYAAPDYHELADAVTFLGLHALDSLQADGKWVRIAVWPTDAYTPAVARNIRNSVSRLTQAQHRIFGGPPYDVYTVFFAVIREPLNFAGGLEHSYSHFNIMPDPAFADAAGNLGDFMNPLMSHEFFHMWNVKRIRPAELWPYDYRAEQFTPLLWWSEGVTDYYADLSNIRAGLWTERDFAANVQSNAEQIEALPLPWSVEDGSLATWIHEVYINSSQLYYPKGSLLGLLLDVSIRDASDNARSLDLVMRALYDRFYRQNKGFRTGDLLALLREFGLPDVDGFYQKYINGREPLPYEQVLPKAGFAVQRRTTTSPWLGVVTGATGQGLMVTEVEPASPAAIAGVLPGDVLQRVGDVPVSIDADWAAEFRRRYQGKTGQPLAVVVRRGGRPLTLNGEVRERSRTSIAISRAATLTAKQARVWRGMTGAAGN
jgi:predicted metalloprotease with PDZ domain